MATLRHRANGDLEFEDEVEAEWQHHRRAIDELSARSWRKYVGARDLKGVIAASRAGMTGTPVPPDEAIVAETTVALKTPALRKQVLAGVARPLGLVPSNLGGGDWEYRPVSGERGCGLHIDYGGMSAQLRYNVVWPASGKAGWTAMTYESLLGITSGDGDWDLITAANCAAAMRMLRRIAATLVARAHDLELCPRI